MKINFIASDRQTELTVDPPISAKKMLPEWYIDTKRFIGDCSNKPIFENGQVKNNSVKACYPFYDSLCSGYIQKTWCDIHFKFDYDETGTMQKFTYNYSRIPEIVSHRDHVSIPISKNFHQIEFTWLMPWIPVMPKGWSVLLLTPMNRPELPFWSPSAIIDSDNFYHGFKGNYPFYINSSFNDKILPAGTPMYQIVPIKRENWKSNIINMKDEDRSILMSKIKNNFIGSYKKFFHQKKIFD